MNPSQKKALGYLLLVRAAIEEETNMDFKVTSFIRDSPSHDGSALDIAPDIPKELRDQYRVTHHSDPMLSERWSFIKQLLPLKRVSFPIPYDVAIFMETDHLHLQLLRKPKPDADSQTFLIKWSLPKESYADSQLRRTMMLKKGIEDGYCDANYKMVTLL